MTKKGLKAQLYTYYPLSSILIYNGTTILHYLLGGIGIIIGFQFLWPGYILGSLYLAFAFAQMYAIMPLVVCPTCVYYRINNARCVSGINRISNRIAKKGNPKDSPKRATGLFCHNNLYMAALIFPIIAMIPGLLMNFSATLLAIFLVVLVLLVFRIVVIFPKTACVHCRAKNECPNAQAMGLGTM